MSIGLIGDSFKSKTVCCPYTAQENYQGQNFYFLHQHLVSTFELRDTAQVCPDVFFFKLFIITPISR